MYPWCDGSAGRARPIEAATRRLGSLVADSATTVNSTWPGFSMLSPSSRSTSSQCGGKIELTRTRLKLARCASRNAISKLVSFSLCRPTPLVRKALVGMNIRESINSLPREKDDRGDFHRRLRVPGAIRRSLHDLGQHLGGAEANFLQLHLGLPPVLAADDEHVFRRVNPQPAPPILALPGHHRRAPLPPLPLDRPEQVQGRDLRGRHFRLYGRRDLGPPGTLPRRYRERDAGVRACSHRST